MTYKYDKLDVELYDLIYNHLSKKKYEVSMTGTTDPTYYDDHRNGAGFVGLSIIVKVKEKDD